MVFVPVSPESGRMVDALDDGRIVRVAESYALREGLLILQRLRPVDTPEARAAVHRARKLDDVRMAPFEALRRPLPRQVDEVTASLIDNFHWILAQKRRERSLSRKRVGEAVGAIEQDIKLIENGILPSKDFVLVSKLENFFGVNLRKEGGAAPAPNLATLRAVLTLSEKQSSAKDEALILAADDLFADSLDGIKKQ